jgi:thioredoxin-like negative regulator of GroEL
VLGTDALRVSIAERVAKKLPTPPLEVMPDLIAGALAQRNITRAIQLLENKRDRDAFGTNEIFLLTYLYCLNGNVEKAETLINDNAANIKKDEFADWLWKKLQDDFGFHPPVN